MSTKQVYTSVFLSLILAISFSCKKENLKDELNSSSASIKSGAVPDYIAVINSQTMSSFEKGQILLSADNLPNNVQKELAEKASLFNPYVIELVFVSQQSVPNIALFSLIENNSVTDGTLISILHSVAPLNQATKNKLTQNRNNISISQFSTSQRDKIISICLNKVYYTDKAIVQNGVDESSVFFQSESEKLFFNSVSEIDLTTVQNGIEGGDWIRGASTVKTSTNSDNITTTSIYCKRPPNTKCMKVVKQSAISLNQNETAFFADLLQTNDDFIKARKITDKDEMSEELKSKILELLPTMKGYAQEASLYSIGNFNNENLIRIIMASGITDAVVQNVLKFNAPVSQSIKDFALSTRPKLNLSDLSLYNTKQVAIALCCDEILVGNNISILELSDGNHGITITSYQSFSFVNSVNEADKQKVIVGGGKWIRGEIQYRIEQPNSYYILCENPPTTKCVKVIKT